MELSSYVLAGLFKTGWLTLSLCPPLHGFAFAYDRAVEEMNEPKQENTDLPHEAFLESCPKHCASVVGIIG
jgi:hypothetical protein